MPGKGYPENGGYNLPLSAQNVVAAAKCRISNVSV